MKGLLRLCMIAIAHGRPQTVSDAAALRSSPHEHMHRLARAHAQWETEHKAVWVVLVALSFYLFINSVCLSINLILFLVLFLSIF